MKQTTYLDWIQTFSCVVDQLVNLMKTPFGFALITPCLGNRLQLSCDTHVQLFQLCAQLISFCFLQNKQIHIHS